MSSASDFALVCHPEPSPLLLRDGGEGPAFVFAAQFSRLLLALLTSACSQFMLLEIERLVAFCRVATNEQVLGLLFGGLLRHNQR